MFYRYINLQINCMHCTAYCKCKSVYVYDCTYTWGKINYSCMQLYSIQYSRVITVCVTKHLSRPLIRKHDRILIDQSRPLCCFEFLMCSFQIHPFNCKYSTMYVQIVDCIKKLFLLSQHIDLIKKKVTPHSTQIMFLFLVVRFVAGLPRTIIYDRFYQNKWLVPWKTQK